MTTLKNIVKRAREDGWEVLVIHPGLFPRVSAPMYPEVALSFPTGIIDMIREFDPDHLHVATEGPLGLRTRIAFRKDLFTTAYHTQWEDILWDILRFPRFITRKFLKWFHSKGTVMVPTYTTARYLQGIGVESDIRFLTRGVDPKRLKPSRKRASSDEHRTRLLCVSRLSHEKNLDVFCSLDHERYDLTLVGDGPLFTQLKDKYPSVRFMGKLDGAELANEYQDADVFVFPSKKDTFGIVMIEAMFFGTPVAAYPVQGPIDVVWEDTGVLNDDLELAIEAAQSLDRKRVSSTSKKTYTWEAAWEQFRKNLVDYYDDL